jgi:uncharacterized protein YqgQ
VEAFQEWTYAAQQLNVSREAITDGFRELNIRASEFAATGGGSAAEAFRQIGFSQERVQEGLRNTEQLMSDLIDRIGEFGRADQIRLADEIFGGQGGEQFMALIASGSAAIAGLRADAQALGVVLREDLFESAREVETRFASVARVIDTQLKVAFMELSPIVLETGNFIVWVAGVIRDIADAIAFMRGEMDQLSTRNLETRLTQLGAERVQLEADLYSLKSQDWRPQNDPVGIASDLAGRSQTNQISNLEAGLQAISDEERRILDILARRDNQPTNLPPAQTIAPTSAGLDQLAKQAEQLMARLRTASEEYARTMDQLNAMLARGLIDQDTYNRAVAEAVLKRAESVETEADYAEALALVQQALAAGIITESQYTEAVEQMTQRRLEAQNDWAAGVQLGLMRIAAQGGDLAKSVGDAWASAFSGTEDALASLVLTGKADFKSLADSIIADLLRISIRQGVTGPIAGMISSFMGGGPAAPIPTVGGRQASFIPGTGWMPVAHDGWMVARGNPPSMRAMSAGLDRYHNGGLNPRERLVVAEEGEGIFTPRQMDNADGLFRGMMRALGAMMQRNTQERSGSRVEVHNHTGAEVTRETTRDSDGLDVEKIVIGTVNAGLGRGAFDTTLSTIFGVQRKGRRP